MVQNLKYRLTKNLKGIADNHMAVPIAFFLACWVLLSAEISAFYLIIRINYYSVHTNVFLGMIDALVILSPYLLLKPKWRRTIAIPMLLMPIYLFAQTLYYRNFGDIFKIKMIFNTQNATGPVLNSAFASIDVCDLWFLVPSLVFIVIYILFFRKSGVGKFSLKFKIFGMLMVFVAFLLQQSFFLHIQMTKSPEKHDDLISRFKEGCLNLFPEYIDLVDLKNGGFPKYWAYSAYYMLKPVQRMSDAEMAEIQNEIYSRPRASLVLDSLPDNHGKNLIFIIVESLNSDGLYVKVNGKDAMPYLSNIIKMEDAFVADNVAVQVGVGRSSDGRFIYHTGLLPDLHDPVALSSDYAVFPSLTKSLGYYGEEFDCGDPIQWNKVTLSKSYGFDKIHTEVETGKDIVRNRGRDGALFVNSMPYIKNMRQPFVAALNTMDMHDPYEKFEWKRSDVWKDNSLSQSEKVYVEKLRQFDTALKNFIEALKKEGLYERSVIVIAGDHNARESMLVGKKFTGREIPFIILNSGLGIKTHAPVAQVDLFPTILDIMGKPDVRWRGFGTSLLRNPAVLDTTLNRVPLKDPYSYPSAEDWELSKRMINGGFFNTK